MGPMLSPWTLPSGVFICGRLVISRHRADGTVYMDSLKFIGFSMIIHYLCWPDSLIRNGWWDLKFGRLGVIQGHVDGNMILIDSRFKKSHGGKETHPRFVFDHMPQACQIYKIHIYWWLQLPNILSNEKHQTIYVTFGMLYFPRRIVV